jgi:hypothetical protein
LSGIINRDHKITDRTVIDVQLTLDHRIIS